MNQKTPKRIIEVVTNTTASASVRLNPKISVKMLTTGDKPLFRSFFMQTNSNFQCAPSGGALFQTTQYRLINQPANGRIELFFPVPIDIQEKTGGRRRSSGKARPKNQRAIFLFSNKS